MSGNGTKDPLLFEMLKDIKESTQRTERKVTDLELNSIKQQGTLENQVKRTDALEKLVLEVRAESKTNVDFLRKEMEDKLRPSQDLHKNISGFWTVVKWCLGLVIAAGGATGAVIAMIKVFGSQ